MGARGRVALWHLTAVLFTLAVAASARSAAAATTTRFLQAEQATVNGACTLDTNQAGFTGTSFVNCPNDTTSFIEWTAVRVQSAGTKRLSFRFANGSTVNRAAELRVNGVVVNGSLAFNPTGAWTTWTKVSFDASLAAGDNVIRLRGVVSGQGLANIDRLDVAEISEATPDWGIAMTESTMLRSPTPASLGGWGYANALRLHGMYRTYQRTGDQRYLNYIKAWVDSVVDATGTIYTNSAKTTVRSLSALDHFLPGRLILDVYDHFPQTNYRNAVQTIRNRFSQTTNSPNAPGVQPTWTTAYPRTNDLGYWHAESKPGELWLDGVFMGQMFLHRYGVKFGGADKSYADDEGTRQIIIQAGHQKDPVTGLFWHAYDQQGDATWPFAPGTNHSQEFWCRAMGWYGMAITEVLAVLDPAHPNRAQVISILQGLVAAWASFQDPATGRWFQIVNKGTNPANWTETSCSAMYSYTIQRAVEAGHVDASFAGAAQAGYAGVLQKISFGADATLAADLTNITDISEGTNIGDETYYFNRLRPVNDNHGLGAFLIMYEHFASGPPPPPPTAPSNLDAADGTGQSVLTWTDNSAGESGFKIERKPQADPDTSFAQVGQVGANVTTHTDASVAAGVYTYRVRAFTGVAHSTYSNTDDATITGLPAPEAPSDLSATVTGGNTAVLTWVDNSTTETGFRVEKKVGTGLWTPLTTKAANVTTHTDGSLSPNSYRYRVVATGSVDSVPSNEVSVVIRNPEADAHVRDGTSANNNYGANTTLEVKNGSAVNNNRQAFLRFTIVDVDASVISAKIRLYGASVTSTKNLAVAAVSSLTWTEGTGTIAAPVTATGVDWNSRPALGSQLATLSVTTSAAYREVDITPYLQAQRSAGAAKISLAITMTTSTTESPTSFNARENTANRPMLVVTSR